MIYSEMSYFDGYHFQHIAEWLDAKRVQRRWQRMHRDMMERNVK